MHYPSYLRDPDETEHYDNTDEPAWSGLLSLIAQHGVEALFAGQAHAFSHYRHACSDLYVLPALTLMREDYSELFRIGPAADYGRNDLDRLGFIVITVYEQGHGARVVRAAGQTLEAHDAGALKQTSSPPLVIDPHKSVTAPLGVELRHPWAESGDIPYNCILDEFVRSKVRNDYPVLTMWELGIRKPTFQSVI